MIPDDLPPDKAFSQKKPGVSPHFENKKGGLEDRLEFYMTPKKGLNRGRDSRLKSLKPVF